MITDLERWRNTHRRQRYAADYLSALDPVARRQAVCETLFYLNRRIRGRKKGGFETRVYALKNQLVEHLYRAGHCTSAAIHHQALKCYCGGDAWCEKCDGTGIYREFDLYYFKFDIGGQVYVWHQPADLVTWPVTLTAGDVRAFEEREPPELDWPLPFDANTAAQVLDVYLRWYDLGLRTPSLARVLRDLIATDLRRRSFNTRRWLALHIWPEVHESDIDEIPF